MLVTIKVTTDGSGAGTGTSELSVRGFLQGVRLIFGGTPAATTDTTIAESASLGRTLLTLTNVNTNGTYNPQSVVHDNTGAAQTFYSPFYISASEITVTVAQGVASTTDAVTVVLNILEA